MRELLTVLNTRAQSFLKRAFEFRWQTVIQNASSLLIFGGFTVAVFFISRFATEYLLTQAHIGLFLFHRFLSMLLYVFFVTVNVGNMIVSFSTLYKSQEVDFLMSLPISHAKIFLIKFVDNFFYSSSTLTLLGLAMLLGYGSFFDLPWYFYFFVMFFVLLPFLLIAGILAITSLMLLIKLGTRIGFKPLLALIVILYGSGVYFYFRATNPMQLVEDVMKLWPNVNEYLGYLDPPFVRFLPNHWVAEFLYWSIQGDYARSMPYFSMLFLTMLGLIALAGLMARRFYYESWLAVADIQAGRTSKNSIATSLFRFRNGFISPRWDALLKRDISLFLREPSQWLHLMLMFLLLCMFLFSLGTLRMSFEDPATRAIAFMTIFMFNGFLVASISLRFVFPLVSMEGDAFWCVKTSPLHVKKLFWYKVVVAFLLVSLIGQSLSFASIYLFERDVLLSLVAAVAMVFMTLTLVALNVGAGSYFAMYKERNPIRVASSQGASLTFLASMVYLTLVVSILMIPLTKYFIATDLAPQATIGWAFGPLAMVGVPSILFFALATGVGVKAIARDNS
jgi:ABC-2 type transport system permease protein